MPEVNVKKKEEKEDQLAKTTGHQLQLTTHYCHSHLQVSPVSVILRVNSFGFSNTKHTFIISVVITN